jgi:hypothetical protein
MWRAFSIFVLLNLLSVGLVVFSWVSARRLAGEHERPQSRRWLLSWSFKGLLVPLTLWIMMNAGISFDVQPFMPQVQAAQNSGKSWIPVFLHVIAAGSFAIGSYWTAVTLGWILARASTGLGGELRSDFKGLCLASIFGMFLPALGIVLFGGWMLLGLAATAMLLPIAGYAPVLLHPKAMPPMYARAISKMKFGKYPEAELEIIRELEKWEDDFEGWMMLAELYATRFNDVPEAEQTILEICDQPKTTPSQIAVALHRLADWHLNLRDDPDAARRALQVICDRLPGTHLARMAQERISRLPRTAEESREQHKARHVPLPALSEQLDGAAAETAPTLSAGEAASAANQLVERLKENPDNVPAREKLARLFGDQLGEADLAIEQVELLLGMADQPKEKQAEWFSLIAAWQLRHKHNADAARQTMQRLIRDYPRSPQAFAAQRRLSLLDAERRMQQTQGNRPYGRI